MNQVLGPSSHADDDRGAIILPVKDGVGLEDLDDLAVIAQRRDEPVIQHQQFLAELKREGIL